VLLNNITLHTWSCKQIATCFGQIGGNISFDYETGKPLACSSLVEESSSLAAFTVQKLTVGVPVASSDGGCACSFI